jgi:hypothetical protein
MILEKFISNKKLEKKALEKKKSYFENKIKLLTIQKASVEKELNKLLLGDLEGEKEDGNESS